MSRYSLPHRQLIAEVFWAAARGHERNGDRPAATRARESARLVRHGLSALDGQQVMAGPVATRLRGARW